MKRRKPQMLLPDVLALVLLAGCAFTQSPFAQQASMLADTFTAASLTLRDAHGGKITAAYARASFVSYQSALSTDSAQLARMQGAPDAHMMQQLVRAYNDAQRAVNAPCLDSGCDWQSQAATLDVAAKQFLAAGGG